MSSGTEKNSCERAEVVSLCALHALPSTEVPDRETHLSMCSERRDIESQRPIARSFASWPTARTGYRQHIDAP